MVSCFTQECVLKCSGISFSCQYDPTVMAYCMFYGSKVGISDGMRVRIGGNRRELDVNVKSGVVEGRILNFVGFVAL